MLSCVCKDLEQNRKAEYCYHFLARECQNNANDVLNIRSIELNLSFATSDFFDEGILQSGRQAQEEGDRELRKVHKEQRADSLSREQLLRQFLFSNIIVKGALRAREELALAPHIKERKNIIVTGGASLYVCSMYRLDVYRY